MSNGVNITRCEKVSLPPLSKAPPPIKLSFFDAFWVPLKPVQKVLIYSCLKPNIPYSTILESLKSSLSSVLLDFLPLAGKLTYVPETKDVEIDLSDPSFNFVEAESDLDAQQLSFNEVIDVVSFSELVPVVDVSVLPFHVLAVQTKHPSLTALTDKRSQLSRRTFQISKESIHLLKQRGTSQAAPSTFSAISAYVWATVARSKSFDPNQETVFSITMDCRTRLNPPIPDGFIGNCIRAVFTKMMTSDLIGEDGLVRACKAIRESVDEVVKDPLGDCEEWVNALAGLPFERLVNASSSPKFRVYDNDFGWGRPDRFEMVSMNTDGEFVLVAGKEEGSVQMTIGTSPDRLEAFTEMFFEGLNG